MVGLLAAGLILPAIARDLDLSYHTVRRYVDGAARKVARVRPDLANIPPTRRIILWFSGEQRRQDRLP